MEISKSRYYLSMGGILLYEVLADALKATSQPVLNSRIQFWALLLSAPLGFTLAVGVRVVYFRHLSNPRNDSERRSLPHILFASNVFMLILGCWIFLFGAWFMAGESGSVAAIPTINFLLGIFAGWFRVKYRFVDNPETMVARKLHAELRPTRQEKRDKISRRDDAGAVILAFNDSGVTSVSELAGKTLLAEGTLLVALDKLGRHSLITVRERPSREYIDDIVILTRPGRRVKIALDRGAQYADI